MPTSWVPNKRSAARYAAARRAGARGDTSRTVLLASSPVSAAASATDVESRVYWLTTVVPSGRPSPDPAPYARAITRGPWRRNPISAALRTVVESATHRPATCQLDANPPNGG